MTLANFMQCSTGGERGSINYTYNMSSYRIISQAALEIQVLFPYMQPLTMRNREENESNQGNT